jgi:hypothetical protein
LAGSVVLAGSAVFGATIDGRGTAAGASLEVAAGAAAAGAASSACAATMVPMVSKAVMAIAANGLFISNDSPRCKIPVRR